MRIRTVAALSLVFTYLFFFEYLPPLKSVHIPFDLEGYHYPLDDYAFQQIREHRLPLWDADVYCGTSLAGNPQAALFYPPMWLVFLANRHQPWLRYESLEVLQFAHLWLGFVLCFAWLRNRKLDDFACALGAGVFAFSGYALLQLQHLGLVCGYAWFPLALWGIDQAADSRSWKPLWKLAVASAMCFLAGYPPIWFVFCVLTMVYALRSVRLAAGAAAALAWSLPIAMVQAWPAWEMAAMKTPGENYGAGVMTRAELWISYIIPNYFDFAMTTPVEKNPGGELLYIGIPAMFGLLALARDRGWRAQRPVVALGVASVILLTNPFGMISGIVSHSSLLVQICRSWYFLCGITIAAAALSASGIDAFLRNKGRSMAAWLGVSSGAALLLLSGREFSIWLRGGGFAAGWRNALDPALMLAAFSLAMIAFRSASGTRRKWLAAAILIAVALDYKSFGTSKRLNAASGNPDATRRRDPHPGLSDAVYQELKNHPEYRIALDFDAPEPPNLRHLGLATPQGRDPLVSAQIHDLLGTLNSAGYGLIDPKRHDFLKLLGVRYFITSESEPAYATLLRDPAFRAIPQPAYYKVFELIDAQPSYSWEQPARVLKWTPEDREFDVASPAGGRFLLAEQLYPGWQAAVDGKPIPIARWHGAFQSIEVPPGPHRVRFLYRPNSVRYGAGISIASILLLIVFIARNGAERAFIA